MYRIYIQEESQTMELNINGNLTINNMIANLQRDGQKNQVLTHNNKTLEGREKIKDKL